MIDTTLITTPHLLTFAAIFVAAAAMFAYEGRTPHKRIGIPLAAITAVGAVLYIPDTAMLWGFLGALLLLAVIGKADEILPLGPGWQLFWQVCIAGILVLAGWTMPYVSNPFGMGVLSLEVFKIGIWFPGGLLAIAWIVLMMNAVNWLDGMDGLAGGVGIVGFGALATVAMLPSIYNTQTLGLALVGGAALLGFFIWNFPPAKVYLGTVGSWFVGMYLALVAMHGGGKIATASLILALPLLDMAIVIVRRALAGKTIWKGDKINHLHHRLLQQGVSPRAILGAAVIVTIWLAVVSVLSGTVAKIIIVTVGIIAIFIWGLRLWSMGRTVKR